MDKKNHTRLSFFAQLLLAFALPVTLLLIVMCACGITPFGSKSTLIWDALLQHKDYYGYLWDVLHGKASIEYSFGKSLGGRMIGLIGFYLSSPLNLFLYFFSKAQIPQFMAFMIVLRIGLCAVTSHIYVRKRFDLGVGYAYILSTLYALMEYNVYYCRNCMWLDGVIMLPLIALGVYRCIKDSRSGLLFVSVFVAIFSNWYTGYMVCLMSGFLFIYEYLNFYGLRPRGRLLEGLRTVGRYLFAMISGVLASMCMLLPACMSLIGGKATNNTQKLTGEVNMNLARFLSGFDVGARVNAQDAPLIFTGTIVLVAVVAYFLCARVSLKEKIGTALLFAFLCMSYCLRDLELLWTAYVRSRSYYFRFSFVFSFVMIMIAAREFSLYERKQVRRREIAAALLVVLSGEVILYYMKELNSPGRVAAIYVAMLTVFIVGVVISRRFKPCGRVLAVSALVLTAAEAGVNLMYAFSDFCDDADQMTAYINEQEDVIEALDEAAGGEFYRYENNCSYLSQHDRNIAVCESLMLGYSSIEHYSSAYDIGVDSFLAYMGYSDYPGRKIFLCETYWNAPNPVADAILSIRYVQSSESYAGYTDTGIATAAGEVYENKYVLPLGYPVYGDMKNLKLGSNPYDNQELLLSAMTGEETSVYADAACSYVGMEDDCEIWNLEMNGDGALYMFVDGAGIHNRLVQKHCEIYVDGRYIQDTCQRFLINSMYLGEYSKGDVVEVKIKRFMDSRGSHRIYAAQLDESAFENAIELLNTGYDCHITANKNKLEGTFSAAEDKMVFLSVPYETAWTATVDSKSVDVQKLAGAFIGIEVPAGTHEIELVYHTPGMKAGAALSLLGFVLFLGGCLTRRIGEKEKKLVKAEGKASAGSAAKRVDYLDIAKGIGIMMVVYAHARGPFDEYLYHMHMPLFFIISGLLYKEEKPLGRFVVGKIKSLYIPYVFWNVLVYTVKSLIHGVYLSGVLRNDIKILLLLERDGQYLGATWFLVSLFEVSIVYKLTDLLLRNVKHRRLIMLVLFSGVAVLGFAVTFEYKLSRTLVLSMFFALGAYVRSEKEMLRKFDRPILAALCAVFFVCVCRFNEKVDMGDNFYTHRWLFVLEALAASYAVLYLCRWLENALNVSRPAAWIKRTIMFFGRHSLDILIWQFVAFRLVIVVQMYKWNRAVDWQFVFKHYWFTMQNGWWLVYFAVGMLAPVAFCTLLRMKPLGYITKKLHIV